MGLIFELLLSFSAGFSPVPGLSMYRNREKRWKRFTARRADFHRAEAR